MDPELIKSVLTQFEHDGKFPTPFVPTGVNTKDLPALLEQLEQAGLLVLYEEGRGESGIFFLTMKGHDFAAGARGEVGWASVKAHVASSGRPATPDTYADLLEDRARSQAGLPRKKR